MKILKHLLFFTILFSFACKKERNPIPNPISEPFFLDSSPKVGVPLLPVGSCETPELLLSDRYCEVIQGGEQYLLTDVTKYWVPQYQFDLGTKFRYKNEAGQTLELNLTNKDNLLVKRIVEFESCSENSTQRRGTCNEVELFYIVLENEAKGVKLYVEMGMYLQTFASSDPEFVQGRIIASTFTPDGPTDSYILWDEEFDESGSLFMITDFEEESILLNRTFQKVLSKGPYFYNKEFGLIAFRDEFNELWVLDE